MYIQNVLENRQKKCGKDGIGDSGYDNILTANYDKLLIVQDYEDLEYMTRKLIDEYELWGLKLNVKN